MAPKRGRGRPKKRTETEIEAEVDSTPSEPQQAESRQSTRLSVEERRELEALWAENATLRAERARSKTQVSVSRSPQTSAQTPISAPRKMIARVPDDEGVSIQDFLKLRTPEFRGEEGEDPQEFLEETEKMTRRLTCSETQVIELIGINMKSNAWDWYQRPIEDQLYQRHPPTGSVR